MPINLTSIDYILILVYFVVLIVIGYIVSRRESKEGFLIADRKLGAWSTMATINASKTGSILMIFVALVYLWGFSAIWYFIGMVLGVLLFLPFGIKLKENSQGRFYTLADYFKYNYGKKSAVVASLITIFLMFGFLILNLIAGTKIFSFFTGWAFWICALIMIIIVLVYLLLGGFKAVVKTDILQYTGMLIILALLAIIVFSGKAIPLADWNLFSADMATMAGFFIVGILYPFAMPDLFQRVYASKDRFTLKKGILISAAIYFVFALLLGIIALTIKAKFPGVDPDLALLYGFQNLLPAGLLGLGVVLLFAAVMSSIDTYIFTAASSIVQDFVRENKERVVRHIRITIVVLAILATIVSIALQSLIIATYIFVAILVVLAVAVMATWIKRSVRQRTLLIGFIFGLIGYFIYVIISLSKGDVQPIIVIYTIIATLIGLLVGLVISLVKRD